ncbi:growth/differentiation factor 2-like [Erpetoichthys calabaricus]|uniref:growth/differentiation factor 2-like n=1 Tax=Erpetoichthys calabaricus TaxID=27687 RepID=UPI002234943B|nr:growth/differentiation factor 2-like [Erpetoichthys calabaricus]
MQTTMNYLILILIYTAFIGSISCKPVSVKSKVIQDRIRLLYSASELEVPFGKNTFLRNSTAKVQKNSSGVQGNIDPVQFMLNLYNQFVSASSSMPQFNTVRSFTAEDAVLLGANGSKAHYLLLFNVSVPYHEQITVAELRLYTLLTKGFECSNQVKYTIKIYDMQNQGNKTRLQLLNSKEIDGDLNSWISFIITGGVKRWVEFGQTTNTLQVHIEQKDSEQFKSGCLKISTGFKNKKLPVIILFSNDPNSQKQEKKINKQMIFKEETRLLQGGKNGTRNMANVSKVLNRAKRNIAHNHCRRTPLHVNFKDIGWDSWIIAPKEYDAFECRGICHVPMTDDVTPTNHAMIQSLLHIKYPKKVQKVCCVPTKLDPISLLYRDESGTVTLKNAYEGMKVAACGCR